MGVKMSKESQSAGNLPRYAAYSREAVAVIRFLRDYTQNSFWGCPAKIEDRVQTFL